MSQYFIDREKGGERALLLQMRVFQSDHYQDFEDALLEFKLLATSAGVDILDVISGQLSRPSPKYFVGEGKAQEVASAVKALDAEVVFVNHELSPAQGRNLEKLFQCRVLDRAELILDIFSQRARTFEGKLQVELAQLEHIRTRLVKGWTHLERQKGGIGLRGPGETQLETDRRLIGGRIKSIKKRLEKVEMQREQNRRSRDRVEVPVVALVGYTNAGKSTLFNQLSSADVYVADQLFATLDPTLRHLEIPKIGKVVLADTVGFVRHLPHELVAAFKATLEETRLAELLLHVVDAQSTQSADLINDVDEVLSEIGASKIPQLLVMNKIDGLEHIAPRIDYHESGLPRRVWISAATGDGIELLEQAIIEILSKRTIQCQVILQSNQGRLRAKLFALGVVKAEAFTEEGGWVLDLDIQQVDFERLFKT